MGSIIAPTVPLIPFTPQANVISNITNAFPAVVTTAQPHGYLTLLLIRFFLPLPTYFGMQQLNGQFAQITVLSSTTFSVPIDTKQMNSFTTAGSNQVPQVIAMGENASTLLQAEKNAFTPIGGS